MKSPEGQSGAAVEALQVRHSAQFMAVRESRNRRVSGIYTRNGRYYGQLGIKTELTARKFALVNRGGAVGLHRGGAVGLHAIDGFFDFAGERSESPPEGFFMICFFH